MSIAGRILLVTGSTQGVGRAIALEAARQGAGGVLITGREADGGASVAANVAALGAPAAVHIADLLDPVAPAAIVSACVERFGRIDALVNAAALTDRASLLTGAREFWGRMFAVNARAPFFLMQRCVEDMRKGKAQGATVKCIS